MGWHSSPRPLSMVTAPVLTTQSCSDVSGVLQQDFCCILCFLETKPRLHGTWPQLKQLYPKLSSEFNLPSKKFSRLSDLLIKRMTEGTIRRPRNSSWRKPQAEEQGWEAKSIIQDMSMTVFRGVRCQPCRFNSLFILILVQCDSVNTLEWFQLPSTHNRLFDCPVLSQYIFLH